MSLFIQIPYEGTNNMLNASRCASIRNKSWNKSNISEIKYSWQVLTFLAIAWGPAAVAVVVIEAGPNALWAVLHDTWTNITAFFGLLVPSDVVVKLGIHNEWPVHRVQVAQLRVLFDSDRASGDVPQVVEANIFQAGHFEDDQGVVVEQVASSDDIEVGEEHAEAIQAGDSEQEKVVGDHGQLGEGQGAKVLLVEVVVLVSNEEDLKVAFHHRAVLQLLELTDVIADVNVRTTDWKEKERSTVRLIGSNHNFLRVSLIIFITF